MNRVVNGRHDAFEVFVDLLHAESHNIKTMGREFRVTRSVSLQAVRRAVDLDDQFQWDAAIVDEAVAYDVLSTERCAERAIAEARPKTSFGL